MGPKEAMGPKKPKASSNGLEQEMPFPKPNPAPSHHGPRPGFKPLPLTGSCPPQAPPPQPRPALATPFPWNAFPRQYRQSRPRPRALHLRTMSATPPYASCASCPWLRWQRIRREAAVGSQTCASRKCPPSHSRVLPVSVGGARRAADSKLGWVGRAARRGAARRGRRKRIRAALRRSGSSHC